MPETYYVTIDLTASKLNIGLDIANLVELFFVALPAMATTANIMLANNICDLESDVAVGRHTLVYYLGKQLSLNLFKIIYALIFVDYALLVMLNVLPLQVFFALLLVAKPVFNNSNKFVANPVKATTFINAIINFLLIMTAVCAGLLLAILL